MTRSSRSIVMLVALLAMLGAGGCRDDRITLAVARDGGGGLTGGGPSDASDAGGTSSDAGTGGVGGGAGGVTDGGLPDGPPEHNDATPGLWVNRTPCVVPADAPEPRELPLLALDADNRSLLFYGGNTLTDLWELDLATATWTSRNGCGAVTPPPGPRAGDLLAIPSQVAYDRARRRLVLFSGLDGVVWEWDRDTGVWIVRPPAPGADFPTREEIATAVYDDTRGKVLVFTTYLPQDPPMFDVSLWEWDGVTGTWTARIPGGLPWPGGTLASVAFDAGRGALWMFGGGQYPASDHLWRLDTASATLTDLTPTPRPVNWPSARFWSQMTYDPARDRVVLLGGVSDTYQRDLWELDPATITWLNRTPANVPSTGYDTPAGTAWPVGDYGTGIFLDAASGQIVRTDNAANYWPETAPALWSWDTAADTWSVRGPVVTQRWPHGSDGRLTAWDGGRGKLLVYDPGSRDLWQWGTGVGRWDHLSPDGIAIYPAPNDPVPWPASRTETAMAWDPGARRLVIFGGTSVPNEALGDLWLWDPATGQMTNPPRPSAGWPSPRSGHAMVYDPVRGRVLMFGGSVPEASDELWALDTAQVRWELVTPTGDRPAARVDPLLVLDEARQVLVLNGGRPAGGTGNDDFFDTWELAAGASAWQQRSPDGAPFRWFGEFFGVLASYVRGLGVVAMAPKNDDPTWAYAIWKWDPVAAAWVAAGVDPPRRIAFDSMDDSTLVAGQESAIAGGDDTLILLIPGAPSRPQYEFNFAETWEWRAP